MELLKQLYRIISKSGMETKMKSFILERLSDLDLSIETDEIGNLFITKGKAETYPCLAAHLDEIHPPCQREVVTEGDIIYTVDGLWNRVGCGADDKNGIWIIINLLHTEPVLKAALFVQEERNGTIIGCRGARACDLKFFDDAEFVIECDRKGSSDLVQIGKNDTLLCPSEFMPQSLLQKYGYEMVRGGKTDVVELKMRGLSIPVCNVSCGYYNAHTNSEYTRFSELQNCLAFVTEFLRVNSISYLSIS